MISAITVYILTFALAGVVCLASVPRALRIQHQGTRHGLVGLLVSVAIWSGGYVGYFLAPTVPGKLTFYTLGFVFAFVAVGSWLYFCAAYTGRPPHQAPYRNLLVGIFLFFISLKITNPLHNLYFTSESVTEPFPHLAIQHELLYWVLLGLSYAVVAVGFFMLVERFYHTGTDTRPLVVLVGLTGVPAVATILANQFDWLLPLMYEPPGVALFAVGLLFVYIRRFETIRVTGEHTQPAIFLDQYTHIRDYNQAARRLFPALDGSIGKPVESVSSELAEHLTTQESTGVFQDDTHGFYDISVTPFMAGEVTTGQLVTITDVTERELYRQQLELKTEQLEALNRVIRHDIRNDMTVILGWAELLKEHVDADGQEALERVLRKSSHVVELTETAREFVDTLSGEEELTLKTVDIHQLLDSELAAVRDSYPNAKIHVSGDIPQVSVQGNEMLSSVFRNLLENAIRHTDEPTPDITVFSELSTDTVRVRIADNGPGVPDDRKTDIFEKGVKGERSTGSGIGLYLVETLLDQFGGDVWVEDNEPKGAVFVVELVRVE